MTITLNGTTGITTPDVTSDSYTGAVAVNASAPDNSLVVDASGKVGINQSSPSYKIDAYSTDAAFVAKIKNFNGTDAGGGLWIDTRWNTSGNRPLKITSNNEGTSLLELTGDGNLLVGTSTPIYNTTGAGSGFELNSAGYLSTKRNATSGAAHIIFHNPNGIVGSIQTINSSTSYLTSSDYRLKQDWQPMTGASERVKALKPVNFAWKVDGSRVDGFLAHEAQAVVPEAVTGEKDAVDAEGNAEYQGIDQSKLVPLLTAALQEALAKIDDLTARVSALEATNV